jgi:hypothetical protein
MNKSEAKAFVDEFYKKVAARWNERVTGGLFMKNLLAGTLPHAALRLFFKKLGVLHDRDQHAGGGFVS